MSQNEEVVRARRAPRQLIDDTVKNLGRREALLRAFKVLETSGTEESEEAVEHVLSEARRIAHDMAKNSVTVHNVLFADLPTGVRQPLSEVVAFMADVLALRIAPTLAALLPAGLEKQEEAIERAWSALIDGVELSLLKEGIIIVMANRLYGTDPD